MTKEKMMAIKCGRGPQWSPLVKSGMTRSCGPPLGAGHAAAMEPAREERDDVTGTGHPCPLRRAAMEPAREERDDGFVPFSVELEGDWPQWSPLVKSGMTCPRSPASSPSCRRNGA